ncbi:MAG: DegT/DnrJ/EryC1/StrS family aminotransferase [Sphaerochaeta sp.]|nr:DegT/DnrJ/EryC1/StrS family aminotransferase [Sphaerochaeta sp.]
MALIPFHKPTLRRKDMDAVLQTMVDERIGPGERKNAFLKQFCELIGAKGGIALRSYVDGLCCALQACELEGKAKIGASILSPYWYQSVVESMGYELLCGDIDPEHGCLAQEEAQRLVEQGCSALLIHLPMCQIPITCDYKQLGVPVIEDITQSLASEYEDRRAGSFGDLILCAFEEDCIVSTGGGAVLAYTGETHQKSVKAFAPQVRPYIELPDMNAALGMIQLATLGEQLAKRRELYALFAKSLLKTPHRIFGIGNIDFLPNGYSFCVALDSKPEDAIKFANKYQVSAKKTFTDTLAMHAGDRFDLYPKAIPLYLRALTLPLYPFLKQGEVELLIKVISHLS